MDTSSSYLFELDQSPQAQGSPADHYAKCRAQYVYEIKLSLRLAAARPHEREWWLAYADRWQRRLRELEHRMGIA